MDEQSRTSPPRDSRKRAKPARPVDAAFTPPTAPAPSPAGHGTSSKVDQDTSARNVRKVPPAVLFQPPAVSQPVREGATTREPTNSRIAEQTPPVAMTPNEEAAARNPDRKAVAREQDRPTATSAAPSTTPDEPATPDGKRVTSAQKTTKKATRNPAKSTPAVTAAGVDVTPTKRTKTAKSAKVTRAKTSAAQKLTKRAPRNIAEPELVQETTALHEATAAQKAVQHTEPVAQRDVAESRTPGVARLTTARLLRKPGYAPELLALAAVETLGPGARDWVHQMSTAYPAATPGGLSRLATQRFVRIATAGGAVSGATGLVTPLAGLATVAWSQAGLVLYLAAAYGQDPRQSERAVDLLVLTRVHADEESASDALAAASGPAEADQSWLAAAHRLSTVTAGSGGLLSARLASRWLPGAALLAAAVGGSAGMQRLAARAISHYRGLKAS